jgi:hypothetical protein
LISLQSKLLWKLDGGVLGLRWPTYSAGTGRQERYKRNVTVEGAAAVDV